MGSCFGGLSRDGFSLARRLKVDWDDGTTEVEVDEADLEDLLVMSNWRGRTLSYLVGVLAAGSDCTLADVAVESVNERGGDGSACNQVSLWSRLIQKRCTNKSIQLDPFA